MNYLTGIILAGGKGIRPGRKKGLVMLGEQDLIEFVIDILSQLFDEILISSNSEQCKRFGYSIVPDEYEAKRPITGIHACLKASSIDHNFIVSEDTPFVKPDLNEYIRVRKVGHLVMAQYHSSGHLEALCAYYSKKLVSDIKGSIEKGNYKIGDFLKESNMAKVPDDDMPSNTDILFYNINTEEDLNWAEAYLKENG